MQIHILRVPTPFPIGPVNLFFIADNPVTLIDTGPNTEESYRSVRSQIEALGLRIQDLQRIVVTHAHEDHAGLAARISRESGAPVYVHPWEAARLTGRTSDMVGRKLLQQIGVPPRPLSILEERRERLRALMDPVPDVQMLDEGDEVAFTSESLRVLHTPGHTPGHICLWREADRTLIASDTVLKRVTPNPIINPDPRDGNRRFPSLIMYLRTLERLRDLSPTRILTGHGDSVDDMGAYWHETLRHIRSRQSRMLEALPPQAVTAWDVSLRLFPNARDDQRFLALSEACAHLDLADDEGRVVREESNGVDYYRVK